MTRGRWFIVPGMLVVLMWGCAGQPNTLEYVQKMIAAGEFEAARGVLKRTLELEPENAEAHYLLGICDLETGRTEEALLSLREAQRLQPAPRSQFALARAYLALKQQERAYEQFLALLQSDSATAWVDEIAPYVTDAHPVRQLTENDVDDYDPAFTSDGTQIVIVSFRVQNAELYLLDLDGRVRSRVTYTDDRNEGSPGFVPGDEWVLCESESNENREAGLVLQASGSTAQDDDLVTVHVYGRQIEPAFPGNNKGSKPSISPDGRRVAFQSVRDRNLEIYVADRKSGEITRLTDHPGDDGTPSFSPDGQSVLFVSSRHGNYELYTIPVTGGVPRRLTHNQWGDYNPVFAPDGRSVVYVSEANGDMELYQLWLDTGKVQQLTRAVGASVQPSFSPDGRYLAFASDRSSFFQIYLMDLHQSQTVEALKAEIAHKLR